MILRLLSWASAETVPKPSRREVDHALGSTKNSEANYEYGG